MRTIFKKASRPFYLIWTTLFLISSGPDSACNSVVGHLGQVDGDELFLYFLEGSHGFESTENIREYMEERGSRQTGCSEHACRIYHHEKLRNITPYPGVIKTLKAIQDRGYAMAIVTDAESPDARMRLDKCGLLPFFDAMVTFDRIGVKKPAPEPFFAALDAVGAKPDEVLFVGDSPRRDIEPSGNSVSVRYMRGIWYRFSKNPGESWRLILLSTRWMSFSISSRICLFHLRDPPGRTKLIDNAFFYENNQKLKNIMGAIKIMYVPSEDLFH